jgi:hypothetical protein
VNMISSITAQGQVRWMIYEGRMNAALFIVFLTRLILLGRAGFAAVFFFRGEALVFIGVFSVVADGRL